MNITPPDFKPAPKALAGKTILVTGAGDGIGRSAALAYARYGAQLVLLSKTLSHLEAVYDQIVQAGGSTPVMVDLDLAQLTEEQCQDLAYQIDSTCGSLEGLLHNASLLGPLTPLEQYPPDTWERVLKVNLTSPLMLTQALLPVMKKAPQASIVMTSSSVGRKGRAYWGAYAVSKFATEGLMQTWADELHNTSSIRVNTINPGATRTRMRAQAYPAENPLTLPHPDEIMGAYLYLMCDESRLISGQSLNAQ